MRLSAWEGGGGQSVLKPSSHVSTEGWMDDGGVRTMGGFSLRVKRWRGGALGAGRSAPARPAVA